MFKKDVDIIKKSLLLVFSLMLSHLSYAGPDFKKMEGDDLFFTRSFESGFFSVFPVTNFLNITSGQYGYEKKLTERLPDSQLGTIISEILILYKTLPEDARFERTHSQVYFFNSDALASHSNAPEVAAIDSITLAIPKVKIQDGDHENVGNVLMLRCKGGLLKGVRQDVMTGIILPIVPVRWDRKYKNLSAENGDKEHLADLQQCLDIFTDTINLHLDITAPGEANAAVMIFPR